MSANFDAWGSTDAWSDAKPATASTVPAPSSSGMGGGWGASPGGFGGASSGGFGGASQKVTSPKVSADEDFGGWSSAPHASAPSASKPAAAKPAGFGGSDDLFSNVWE